MSPKAHSTFSDPWTRKPRFPDMPTSTEYPKSLRKQLLGFLEKWFDE